MSALLTLQAGSSSCEGSKDPRTGLVAIKLKCVADDLLTAITGDLPAFGVEGLQENQARTWSRRIGGDADGYDVMVTLEGHLSPGDAGADGQVEYSLEGATSDDVIESHWNYAELLEVYEGTEDASTGKAKWPKTIGDDDARNPMHGVEKYLVPGLTWSRKFCSPNLPSSLAHELGTIDSPPGNPPELRGRRNWVKIRGRATWRGNVWLIEESWLLSGPDGWVPEMYRYT